MIGNALEYPAQVSIGFHAIQTRCPNQAVDHRRTVAAAVGAGEQIVAPTHDERPN
ncbi:hypothetical protein P3T23_001316 [Paraburkholderia sp. GAS448]